MAIFRECVGSVPFSVRRMEQVGLVRLPCRGVPNPGKNINVFRMLAPIFWLYLIGQFRVKVTKEERLSAANNQS